MESFYDQKKKKAPHNPSQKKKKKETERGLFCKKKLFRFGFPQKSSQKGGWFFFNTFCFKKKNVPLRNSQWKNFNAAREGGK